MTWIGPPGRMMEIKCPAALDVLPADQRLIFDSLGKRRSITEPGASAPYQTWALSISAAYPREVANLRALSLREWGTQPFYWVPPAAEATNLLSPSMSMCTAFHFPQPPGSAQGGPVLTDEGWAGQSWVTGFEQYGILGKAPYAPGHPVAVRFWADTTAPHIRLVCRNSVGAEVQTFASPTFALTEPGWVSHTFTNIPPTTAYVMPHAVDVVQWTRPSVTWTEVPRAWDLGAACMSVSVQPLPARFLRATGAVGRETLTEHAFEIMEFAS